MFLFEHSILYESSKRSMKGRKACPYDFVVVSTCIASKIQGETISAVSQLLDLLGNFYDYGAWSHKLLNLVVHHAQR